MLPDTAERPGKKELFVPVHRSQPGVTPDGIAKRHGIAVQALAQENRSPNLGQKSHFRSGRTVSHG